LVLVQKREIPKIDGVSYMFESVLGHGGAAEVWKVRSSMDDEAYALKRIAKADSS
jgi:serine/threonine protein kinase